MTRTRQHFFPAAPTLLLGGALSIPENCQKGTFKCRIIYAEAITKIEFLPYTPRSIRSLRLVHDGTIEYAWKYEDRSAIEHLLTQKESCDDILIVKNDCLTDSSYSNIACFDGTTWFTPKKPLLQGIQRERLLREGQLCATQIRVEDLKYFSQIALINAMLDLGDCVLDATNIVAR